MKKFWVFLFILACVLPVGAQTNIKMLTYFPTPQAIYPDLQVKEALHVGMSSKKSAKLNTAGTPIAVTGNITVPYGTLSLGRHATGNGAANGKITVHNSGSNALFWVGTNGDSGSGSKGELKFNHAFLIRNGVSNPAYDSIEANFAKIPKLSFNGWQVQTCDNNGSNYVRWAKVKFNSTTRVYLACGVIDAGGSASDPGVGGNNNNNNNNNNNDDDEEEQDYCQSHSCVWYETDGGTEYCDMDQDLNYDESIEDQLPCYVNGANVRIMKSTCHRPYTCGSGDHYDDGYHVHYGIFECHPS